MFPKATIIPATLNDRCFDCVYGRIINNLNRSSLCLLENPSINPYGCKQRLAEDQFVSTKKLKAELV